MIEIKNESDLVIVPKTYFDGMQDRLGKLISNININDFETMEQLIYLRDWLTAAKVDREMRNIYPKIRWENVRLLLPPEENYPD